MQSAAQRRSSSKNLRNCENIADMASGYENWRSRLIFNMLSTSLWRGWEMLRVRLRFRMKGRVWYHLGNWGSWSSIPISDLVYTDAVVARPGTSENACMAPPQEPNMTNKFVPCLVGRIHKKFCWNMLNNSEHRIQHHSTYKHLKYLLKVSRLSHFRLSLRHSSGVRQRRSCFAALRPKVLTPCIAFSVRVSRQGHHFASFDLRRWKNVFFIFFLEQKYSSFCGWKWLCDYIAANRVLSAQSQCRNHWTSLHWHRLCWHFGQQKSCFSSSGE